MIGAATELTREHCRGYRTIPKWLESGCGIVLLEHCIEVCAIPAEPALGGRCEGCE